MNYTTLFIHSIFMIKMNVIKGNTLNFQEFQFQIFMKIYKLYKHADDHGESRT